MAVAPKSPVACPGSPGLRLNVQWVLRIASFLQSVSLSLLSVPETSLGLTLRLIGLDRISGKTARVSGVSVYLVYFAI